MNNENLGLKSAPSGAQTTFHMKYNKIYVLAPYSYATGGVELAHQLVDYLRNHNQKAYIVYVNERSIEDTNVVTESYRQYNISIAKAIEDNENNILVLPEIYFDFIYEYTKIRIACWWMSVDGRYSRTNFWQGFRYKKTFIEKLRLIKWLLFNRNLFFRNDNNLLYREDKRITHFYQSAYAQHHLYNKGFSKVLPLSDYINTQFIGNLNIERKNIVIYNPAKGYKFTKKIIASMPDVEFVALKGFTREKLVTLMNTAKLYIDFGSFPGKDRLPREAVINGCVILTGKLGASYFYEDVAIPSSYKIKTKNSNIPIIKERIEYILEHYNDCKSDMEFYKSRILEEKGIFYNEIKKAFT